MEATLSEYTGGAEGEGPDVVGTDAPMDPETSMKPRYKELDRRSAVVNEQTALQNQLFDRAPQTDGGALPPFRHPEQRFVVYNLAHTAIPPRVTGTDPAIRICGIFEDAESARDHALAFAGRDSDCSVLISPTHEWVVTASSFEMLQDVAGGEAHKQALLGAHAETMAAHRREFDERVAAGAEGETADRPEKPPSPAHPAESEDEDEAGGRAPAGRRYGGSFPRDLEVRNQQVAVVSFLPDTLAPEGAPTHSLFVVWGCFETASQADLWVRNVGGDRISDFALDTVDMYEWLFPQSFVDDKATKVVYRNSEQQRIMDFAQSQQSTVESFKQFCADEGRDVPSIEI